MQATDDPYSSIRDEIASEINHITALEAQLFSGHPEAKQQLKHAFQDVQEQLSALETAVKSMVDSPAKFNLDPTTAFMRQVEVETLRFQVDDLQRTCGTVQASSSSSSSSSREVEMHSTGANARTGGQRSLKLPPPMRHSKLTQQQQQQQYSSGMGSSGGSSSNFTISQQPCQIAAPAPAGAKTDPLHATKTATAAAGWSEYSDAGNGGWDQYEDVVQQQVLQQQDEALGHISIHVDRIKQQGRSMHEELEEQALLLDGLTDDTDASQMRLRGLRRKVADVLQQSRHDRQLCLILGLSLLLIILTVIALA